MEESDVHVLVLPRIDHPRNYLPNIGTRTYEQENHEEKRVEVEKRRLCFCQSRTQRPHRGRREYHDDVVVIASRYAEKVCAARALITV